MLHVLETVFIFLLPAASTCGIEVGIDAGLSLTQTLSAPRVRVCSLRYQCSMRTASNWSPRAFQLSRTHRASLAKTAIASSGDRNLAPHQAVGKAKSQRERHEAQGFRIRPREFSIVCIRCGRLQHQFQWEVERVLIEFIALVTREQRARIRTDVSSQKDRPWAQGHAAETALSDE